VSTIEPVTPLLEPGCDVTVNDESLAAIQKAMAIYKRWLSADTLVLGQTLVNYGDVLARKGQPEEARTTYRRARKIIEATLPESNPDRFGPLMGLASVTLARGEVAEAILMFERVVDALEKSGAVATDVADARFNVDFASTGSVRYSVAPRAA